MSKVDMNLVPEEVTNEAKTDKLVPEQKNKNRFKNKEEKKEQGLRYTPFANLLNNKGNK